MPRTSEVFPSGSTPVLTYVQRTFRDRHTGAPRDPEQEIRSALSRKGVILQLIGPSKSGKTVAVERIFGVDQLVKVSGSEVDDAKALWRIVVSYLRLPVSRKLSVSLTNASTDQVDITASVKALVAEAGTKLVTSATDSLARSATHDQLDDHFMLARNELQHRHLALFLDDFHAIPEEQKAIVASQLKRAAEDGVQICLAEVPHRSDDPIRGMPDLTGRLRRVEFEYWRSEDLLEIGNKGFSALGLIVGPSVVSALATEACGSPQLMQLLCSNLCDHFGVSETIDPPRALATTLSVVTHVCCSALNSMQLEGLLHAIENEFAMDESPQRYSIVGMESCSIAAVLLAALAMDPPLATISLLGESNSLLRRAHSLVSPGWAPPTTAAVTLAMRKLRKAGADFSGALPPIDMDALGRVTVVDPYFYFFLRWQAFHRVRVTVRNATRA
jgi:hypothetical protein